MTVYKLSTSMFIFLMAMLVSIALLGLAILIPALFSQDEIRPAPWFALVWFGFLSWVWFFYLRIPYAITYLDDDSLEFRGLIRKTRVPVKDIISIKAVPLAAGFIKIKTRRGSIRLINQITGLYELLGRVKALNPEVEIKGC